MARALAACERYVGPLAERESRRATVYQEMNLGAVVGLVACLAYACLAGAPVLVFLAAVPVGFCIGSVIGLMLWNSSADLPGDPVLPPARGRNDAPAAQGTARPRRSRQEWE